VFRFGILGASRFALNKMVPAMQAGGDTPVVALASRDRARAAETAAKLGIAKTHGSYEELLADPDVDGVYIPLPNHLHVPWAERAAAAGKHVLVEKPVGITAADVREMLAACERSGVQFMDGVMFMHSRRLEALRATLDDGESVGRVRRIAAHFSFNAPDSFVEGNIRGDSRLEPHGCLGDLGWYTIRLALWVMKGELPVEVSARLLAEAGPAGRPDKVPFEFSAEMLFNGGVSASFYCAFQAENQQWAVVSGTKGYVHVPDFVLPFFGDEVRFEVVNSVFQIGGCDFDMQRRARQVVVPEYGSSRPNAQEANMFRNFSTLVGSGRRDPRWGEIALGTQLVLDACVRSARSGRPENVSRESSV